MAPLLVTALTTLGPTLLRALGRKKGGIAADAAEAVASTIEQTAGASSDAKHKSISDVVSTLPPEQRAELMALAVEGDRIKAELRGKEIEAEKVEFQEEQATHRAALQSSDVYTVRTRPLIARQSWYVACIYAITVCVITPFLKLVAAVSGDIPFSWEAYLALSAPALAYMGVRTLDKVFNLKPTQVRK